MYDGDGHINEDHTENLTPHIASHKSQALSEKSVSNSTQNDVHSSRSSNIYWSPADYKSVPIISYESFQHTKAQASHVDLPIYAFTPPKSLPQDLSAHKAVDSDFDDSKQNSHVSNVEEQNIEDSPVSYTTNERPYCKLSDGRSLPTSQIFVSTTENDSNSLSEGVETRVEDAGHIAHSNSSTILEEVTAVHSHQAILQEGQIYYISNPATNSHYISEELPIQNAQIIKQENFVDQKDFVKQVFHATVIQNSQKESSNHKASNLSGDGDFRHHQEIVYQSAFFNPDGKSHEYVLMNCEDGTLDQVKIPTSATFIQTGPEEVVGEHIVVLDDSGSNLMIASEPLALPKRRKSCDTTEFSEVTLQSLKLKDKKSESEDQKERRRIREADRMRKKRLLEDEHTKEKRRKDAADRARARRKNLTGDQKKIEREKAAIRMRIRRKNESEAEKKMRRVKAADRMRRRRLTQTFEKTCYKEELLKPEEYINPPKFKYKKKVFREYFQSDSHNTAKSDPLSSSNVIIYADTNKGGAVQNSQYANNKASDKINNQYVHSKSSDVIVNNQYVHSKSDDVIVCNQYEQGESTDVILDHQYQHSKSNDILSGQYEHDKSNDLILDHQYNTSKSNDVTSNNQYGSSRREVVQCSQENSNQMNFIQNKDSTDSVFDQLGENENNCLRIIPIGSSTNHPGYISRLSPVQQSASPNSQPLKICVISSEDSNDKSYAESSTQTKIIVGSRKVASNSNVQEIHGQRNSHRRDYKIIASPSVIKGDKYHHQSRNVESILGIPSANTDGMSPSCSRDTYPENAIVYREEKRPNNYNLLREIPHTVTLDSDSCENVRIQVSEKNVSVIFPHGTTLNKFPDQQPLRLTTSSHS